MKYCILSSLLLSAVLCLLPAAETTAPPAAVQDLVFFTSSRPVRLRLHVLIDGKPFRAAWDEYIDQLFTYLDQDGDGVLNEEEKERAPKPQLLQQQLRGNFAGEPQMMNRRRTPELSVKLLGGKVQRQGLATYYHYAGLQAFIVSNQDRDADSDRLTETLLGLLDVNKDGKLTKDELLAAEALLKKLDVDDDEVISIAELLPPTDPERQEVQQRRMQNPRLEESQAFYALGAEDDAERIAHRAVSLYDKDRNEKLDAKEIGLAKPVFDELDSNRDGRLDLKELEGWLKRPPELALTVRLGRRGEKGAALEITSGGGLKPALGAALVDGILTLTPDDMRIDLRVLSGPSGAFVATRQALKEQFQAADTDQNQYLDEKEAERVPFFQMVFVPADQDGDGKLTAKEFDAYLDMQAKAAGGSTSLTIRDHGRALFATLDANGDGRLGPRELRTLWQRLAALDRDGNGSIARDELPRQFHLTIGQGPPAVSAMREQAVAMPARPNRFVPASGPLWFRKMDRNGDGDVSRREFPGTPDDFKRLDTDGDGLISAEEAERLDAKLRKRE